MDGCTVLALGYGAIMERGRIDVVYICMNGRLWASPIDSIQEAVVRGRCLNVIVESLVINGSIAEHWMSRNSARNSD